MKPSAMLFGILVLTLSLAACGPQSNAPLTPVDVEMSIRVEPEPLAVGETTLIVKLADETGTPIDGAILRVHCDMDHEGMMPIEREVSESANGEYLVPFEWTMGGGWILTITAQLPDNGGEITESFDFFVEAVSSESVINRDNSMDMTAEVTAESTMSP